MLHMYYLINRLKLLYTVDAAGWSCVFFSVLFGDSGCMSWGTRLLRHSRARDRTVEALEVWRKPEQVRIGCRKTGYTFLVLSLSAGRRSPYFGCLFSTIFVYIFAFFHVILFALFLLNPTNVASNKIFQSLWLAFLFLVFRSYRPDIGRTPRWRAK